MGHLIEFFFPPKLFKGMWKGESCLVGSSAEGMITFFPFSLVEHNEGRGYTVKLI